MPSLDDLPLEILYSIARFVGSECLRTQAGILVLFQRWWQVAQVVAYEDLTLSIKTINRYLEVSKSVQSRVRASVMSLNIMIIETEENHPELSTMEESMDNHRTLPLSGVPQNIATRNDWWIHVKESLVRFASQLTHMRRLESFSMVLFVYFEATHVQDDVSFISISTLLSSLPTNLFSLTIDNSGTPSNLAPERQERCNDFCSLLLDKSFTLRLRHLRIRSRNLCPEILRIISPDRFAQLESLIINLSLGPEELPWIFKVFYSHFCLGFQTNGKDLYSTLVDAAKAIVPRLPCLKTLRLIRHKYPAEDLSSFDVVSGQYVILPPGTDWKATDYVDVDNLSEYNERSEDSFSGTESSEEVPWLDLGSEQTF